MLPFLVFLMEGLVMYMYLFSSLSCWELMLHMDSVPIHIHCTYMFVGKISMETKGDGKKTNNLSGLRIEQVSGSVESPTDGTVLPHLCVSFRSMVKQRPKIFNQK